jgi:hypothetical protein
MTPAIRILVRGAVPMALAIGAVGALSTAAWASPPSAAFAPSAALSTTAVSTPLPAWGYDDDRHHTDRDHCRGGGGHEEWDSDRHHWYCHDGRYDQYWY